MTTTSSERDEAIASLSAFRILPDWLAAGMDAERVGASLVAAVPELRAGALRLEECLPERLRAKEDRWLVRYTVQVKDGDGRLDAVVLVGELLAPSRAVVSLDGTASSSHVPFGEVGWWCWLPDVRLRLEVQTSDQGLPALPMLVEPDAAARLLQPVLEEAGFRGARIATCEPDVVRYKPGSRCTVVVRLGYAEPVPVPAPPSLVVLKTHQGTEKGQAAWEAMNELWDRPEAWRGVVSLAQPLAYRAEERILVQGPVPEERTLKELARQAVGSGADDALEVLRGELDKTARALAAIHGSGAAYRREATLDGELAEIAEVVDRLARTVPELDSAAGPFLRWMADRAARTPADPMVPAHHDFRPAQVLLHQGQVGFIDFDGACMAEPALDLGRFRAKLRDIGISALYADDPAPSTARIEENLRTVDGLCEHFLDCYRRHAPVTEERVLLWESADLFTSMLHAWTKVRLQRLAPRLEVLRHQMRGG